MTATELEPCPGCGARLPKSSGPTHRYIGASAACWEIFSALANAGEPPVAPGPFNALLLDAYAVQHPGTPSAQAIQSVAVHLLALYGVLVKGVAFDQVLWIRQRALDERRQTRRGRFAWLSPPELTGHLTVVDIVKAPTPAARSEQVKRLVESVWSGWAQAHASTIAGWYEAFVAPA